MNLPLILLSAAILHAQVPTQHQPKAPAPKQVLATVDGLSITREQVEPLLWDWRGQEVVQDLVTFELIKAEAHRLKVDVPQIEVLKVIDDQLRQVRASVPPGKDVDAALREQGFPQSRLYLRVKSDLMLQRLVDKQFDPSGFVKVSTMIFAPASAAATDVAAAVKKAEDASAKLTSGAKWDDVLKETQSDPGLVGANGLLGWRKLTAFPEPSRGELSKGDSGLVTKPVQTSSGIQIFRLEASGAKVGKEEVAELKSLYLETAKNELLHGLRSKAKVQMLWK